MGMRSYRGIGVEVIESGFRRFAGEGGRPSITGMFRGGGIRFGVGA